MGTLADRVRDLNAALNARLFSAFPDIHAKILRILEQGNMVSVEYETTGTQTGALPRRSGEIPPTGRRLTQRGASIALVDESGRIVMQHEYFNLLDLLIQLGLWPAHSPLAEPAGSR